jgi:hypothetical protein
MSYAPFEQIGLELFAEPGDGMFVWARFPPIEDSLALAEASQRAPGTVFPSASRALSVDEIQCRRMRGHARAALATAAGSEQGDVKQPAEKFHLCPDAPFQDG